MRDYKQLYNDLLKEYSKLQDQHKASASYHKRCSKDYKLLDQKLEKLEKGYALLLKENEELKQS